MSKQQNIATKRTTWNAAWTLGVIVLVARVFHVDVSLDDPVLIVVLTPVVGVVYRVSRWLADTHPALGRILFGSNTDPVYVDPQSDG